MGTKQFAAGLAGLVLLFAVGAWRLASAPAATSAEGEPSGVSAPATLKTSADERAQIPELAPVFGQMARGNSMLEFENGRFERVSGLKAPELMVEKAGWSWSGQFLDFNNDGFLDIYTLSGNYTAPEEVEIPIDT